MILALRICFSVFVVLAAAALSAPATTVRGSLELLASRDPMVRKHKDYSGVVVWLEPLDGSVAAANPGRTAFTLMPNRAVSIAVHRVNALTAPLDAA